MGDRIVDQRTHIREISELLEAVASDAAFAGTGMVALRIADLTEPLVSAKKSCPS
jgi:hypothetical protein